MLSLPKLIALAFALCPAVLGSFEGRYATGVSYLHLKEV